MSCCGCGCGCGSSEYTKRLNKMQNKGDHPPNVAVKRFLDQIDEGHQRNISDRPQPIVFRTCCYFISRRCLPAKSFSKMVLRAPYFSANSLKRDSIARRCIIQNVGAPPGPHQGQGHAARAGSGAEAAARMRAGPPPQGAALPRAPQQHHRCRASISGFARSRAQWSAGRRHHHRRRRREPNQHQSTKRTDVAKCMC